MKIFRTLPGWLEGSYSSVVKAPDGLGFLKFRIMTNSVGVVAQFGDVGELKDIENINIDQIISIPANTVVEFDLSAHKKSISAVSFIRLDLDYSEVATVIVDEYGSNPDDKYYTED